MATYTVKKLCWLGYRLVKSIAERRQKQAEEKAKAAKGGAR